LRGKEIWDRQILGLSLILPGNVVMEGVPHRREERPASLAVRDHSCGQDADSDRKVPSPSIKINRAAASGLNWRPILWVPHARDESRTIGRQPRRMPGRFGIGVRWRSRLESSLTLACHPAHKLVPFHEIQYPITPDPSRDCRGESEFHEPELQGIVRIGSQKLFPLFLDQFLDEIRFSR
jgi:hypothetical protein